jgi:hypothetical protein
LPTLDPVGEKLFNRSRIDREHYLDIQANIRGDLDRYLGGDRVTILERCNHFVINGSISR